MHIAESFASWLIENGADEGNRDVHIYGEQEKINGLTQEQYEGAIKKAPSILSEI